MTATTPERRCHALWRCSPALLFTCSAAPPHTPSPLRGRMSPPKRGQVRGTRLRCAPLRSLCHTRRPEGPPRRSSDAVYRNEAGPSSLCHPDSSGPSAVHLLTFRTTFRVGPPRTAAALGCAPLNSSTPRPPPFSLCRSRPRLCTSICRFFSESGPRIAASVWTVPMLLLLLM